MAEAALCWCNVVARGRCTDCGRAFCATHGQIGSGSSRCEACHEAHYGYCAVCGTAFPHTCSRCSVKFCSDHGTQASGGQYFGSHWIEHQPALCATCTDADHRAEREAAERMRALRGELFPNLFHAETGEPYGAGELAGLAARSPQHLRSELGEASALCPSGRLGWPVACTTLSSTDNGNRAWSTFRIFWVTVDGDLLWVDPGPHENFALNSWGISKIWERYGIARGRADRRRTQGVARSVAKARRQDRRGGHVPQIGHFDPSRRSSVSDAEVKAVVKALSAFSSHR